jgi:hypothetical protein
MTGVTDKLGEAILGGGADNCDICVSTRKWSINLMPKNNIPADRRRADSNYQDDLTNIADSLGKSVFPMFTPGKIRPVRKSVKKLHRKTTR